MRSRRRCAKRSRVNAAATAKDDAAVTRRIDAIWRIESARVIAAVARLTGDVGLAEDFAQDALVAALERWPADGVPRNPGAWLTTTARNRALDALRRDATLAAKRAQLGYETDLQPPDPAEQTIAVLDDEIGDDLLRLVFTACHPVLSREARIALTLRLLGGLTTSEIARAYLTTEQTVAQRIVRAKRKLASERVPFAVPTGDELDARLSSVLEVIYLIFNEGYAATAGDDWLRPGLCEDALRLGRIVAELEPAEPEVHGLVAIMELQASRSSARVGPDGAPILLLDQDRGRWNRLLIRRGLAALERAQQLGGADGPYALQAAIAACHARATTAADTDWRQIVTLYERLAQVAGSPVVELNRAVAVSMADGPAAGLAIADRLVDEPKLAGYHLLPSVRADLLMKLGRRDDACAEFERAASMTQNGPERALLLRRGEECRR